MKITFSIKRNVKIINVGLRVYVKGNYSQNYPGGFTSIQTTIIRMKWTSSAACTENRKCLTVPPSISHHVHVPVPLRVRGSSLYACPRRMRRLLTQLLRTVRVNKASARTKQEAKLQEILKAFLFSPLTPLHLLLLYFCGRHHHLHPLLFSSPLQTQITSA